MRFVSLVFCGVLSFGLVACGGESGAEADTPAAAKAPKPKAQPKLTASGDPQAEAFAKVLLSKDKAAMDALIADGNVNAQLHYAAQIALREDASEAEKATARDYMDAAVAGGNANAMYQKSQDLMADGELYAKNVSVGHEIGLMAAKAGDPAAMLQTGIRYQYGLRGAEQDSDEARKWLQAAMDAGELRAKRQLAELGD